MTVADSIKSSKVEMIIDVAQKRFGIYGVEKTSMQEIADDLKLSKASLYYYFPDKESLYKAVVVKEQVEFLSRIKERMISIKEPEQLIREYSVARLSYFKTLLNISRLRMEAYSDLKPVFKSARGLFLEKEKEIIVKIFNEGIKMGIFFINDPDKTASIFLDLLKGLRISVVNDKLTLTINQEEYEKLLENTIIFTDIFIKGLKTR